MGTGGTQLVIDIGPGLTMFLDSVLVALPGIIAAIYGYQNKQAIATANSKLGTALAMNANSAGEAKLTITPLADTTPKVG